MAGAGTRPSPLVRVGITEQDNGNEQEKGEDGEGSTRGGEEVC